MRFVVKLGGSALEDQTLLHGCARAIAVLAKDGNEVEMCIRDRHRTRAGMRQSLPARRAPQAAHKSSTKSLAESAAGAA